MTFIRLAGCSVGCPLCDTDYGVHSKVELEKLVECVVSKSMRGDWVWITGGEPADHDLRPLVMALRHYGRKIAVATSGIRDMVRYEEGGADWYSVSPHDPAKWVMRHGNELKLVPGLNGYAIADFVDGQPLDFGHKYVMPCDGKPETVAECLAWVESNAGWTMTVQAHKLWNLA